MTYIQPLLEPLFIIFIITSGAVLLRRLGYSLSFWLLPLGLLCGMCQFVVINYSQVLLPVTSSPLVTMSVMLSILLVCVIYLYRNSLLPTGKQIYYIQLSLALVAVSILVITELNLVKFHYDSYLYLLTGRYIANNDIGNIISLYAQKRFGSAAIIHSSAESFDRLYLRSITPLLSLTTLSLFPYFLYHGFKEKITAHKARLIIGLVSSLGVVLLVTNHSYLFHSFYINGHMIFASLMLVFIGAGWLIASEADIGDNGKALIILQALAVIVMIATRPEGALVVGVAMLPQVLSKHLTDVHKRLILYSFGVGVLLTQAFLVKISVAQNSFDPASLLEPQRLGFIILGLGSIFSAKLLFSKFAMKNSERLLWLTEFGLWALLGLYYLRGGKATIAIRKALNAFYENFVLGKGDWDALIVGLTLLTLAALVVKSISQRQILRFPVTAFIPLSLIIGVLRGGGYRVGNGDSFNRAILHLVPAATLFILVALLSSYLKSQEKIKPPAKKVN